MTTDDLRDKADELSCTANDASVRDLARIVVKLCEKIADLEQTKLNDPEFVIAPHSVKLTTGEIIFHNAPARSVPDGRDSR